MERGGIVHRAASRDLLNDAATLDRLIGLRIEAWNDNSRRAEQKRVLGMKRSENRILTTACRQPAAAG